MDFLVSENESSSSELLSNAAQIRISDQGGSVSRQENGEQQIRQKEYQSLLSSEEEEEGDTFDECGLHKDNDSETNIKNEMMKSKITTSASVVLNRLPPDSSKVIKRITQETDKKITIRCQPIGSAPQLSPTVFKISEAQPFATLIKFITKKLKRRLQNKDDVIYCYVNNSFAPSPDEIIGNLHKHFATNNQLVVSYCNVVAFG